MSPSHTTRTYLDTCVLIAAVRGDDPAHQAAMAVLDDPDRTFLTSDFVRLETLPTARREHRCRELAFLAGFFKAAQAPERSQYGTIVDSAIEVATETGLRALDALHVAAARAMDADAIVTGDKAWEKLSAPPVQLLETASR